MNAGWGSNSGLRSNQWLGSNALWFYYAWKNVAPEKLSENGLFSKQFLSISIAVRDGHVERVGPVLLVLEICEKVDQILK